MSRPVKSVIAVVMFVIGAGLVVSAFGRIDTLWLLIPGVIMLLVSYPWMHVLWAEWTSKYRHKEGEAIIAEAEAEMKRGK